MGHRYTELYMMWELSKEDNNVPELRRQPFVFPTEQHMTPFCKFTWVGRKGGAVFVWRKKMGTCLTHLCQPAMRKSKASDAN